MSTCSANNDSQRHGKYIGSFAPIYASVCLSLYSYTILPCRRSPTGSHTLGIDVFAFVYAYLDFALPQAFAPSASTCS